MNECPNFKVDVKTVDEWIGVTKYQDKSFYLLEENLVKKVFDGLHKIKSAVEA